MAFMVEDFSLPQIVADLAEAQRRAEERLAGGGSVSCDRWTWCGTSPTSCGAAEQGRLPRHAGSCRGAGNPGRRSKRTEAECRYGAEWAGSLVGRVSGEMALITSASQRWKCQNIISYTY